MGLAGNLIPGLDYLVISLECQPGEPLYRSTRPKNFSIHGRVGVLWNADNYTLIVGGEIARATGDPTDQFSLSNLNRYLCTNRITIAFGSLKVKSHPCMLTADVIVQEHRSVIQAREERVDPSVVVKIAHGQAPGAVSRMERGPSLLPHIPENAVPVVVEEERRLLVFHINTSRLNYLVDVAVHNQQV